MVPLCCGKFRFKVVLVFPLRWGTDTVFFIAASLDEGERSQLNIYRRCSSVPSLASMTQS